MKKLYCILGVLFFLSSSVHAGGFSFRFGDFFPGCAANSENYNLARCGAEFMVPNFHLGMIKDMFIKMFSSLLLFDAIASFINSVVADPVGLVNGLISSIFKGADENPLNVITNILTCVLGVMVDYFLGVLTPFVALLILMTWEFIKTYLILAIPFCLWSNVFGLSRDSGVYIAYGAIVLMFIGSAFLLGSDLGLYSILFNLG